MPQSHVSGAPASQGGDDRLFFTGFTVIFVKQFCFGIGLTSPILVFLALVITTVGLLVGRREGWSRLDALYWAFITATTIGYGDFRPTKRGSRVLAVLLGFLGLMLSGILVAVAIEATTKALQAIPHETLPVETQGMAIPPAAIQYGIATLASATLSSDYRGGRR
ncbi:MAG TPA: potassium channel family protein [Pseudacidobacterium sp.]|jgi:voltage-gated potassium channel|nr:potassium channel family protein [Pseudacidobacterium sp.]